MYSLILASQSPRRRQILEQSGYSVTVDTVKVSEIIKENLKWEAVLLDLAGQKLDAYKQARKPLELKGKIVLTADTLVIFENRPLGKPKNPSQAVEFLKSMSGKQHEVMTSVLLFNGTSGESVGGVETTKVQFKELSQNEIEEYVATGEPMDKAGAYGIQGKGGDLVDSIEGPFDSVVGLPMELVEKLLSERGWNVHRSKL